MCIFLLNNIIEEFKDLFKDERYRKILEVLQMILSQMFLLECFVEDLLSYNMIQSGAFTLKPVDFDPQ